MGINCGQYITIMNIKFMKVKKKIRIIFTEAEITKEYKLNKEILKRYFSGIRETNIIS